MYFRTGKIYELNPIPGHPGFGKRMEFKTWYTQQQNDQFDFAEEILAYCQSDVEILWMVAWHLGHFSWTLQVVSTHATPCSGLDS